MLFSPETNDFIARVRARLDAGTATKDDFKAVVAKMRGDRMSAAAANSASKSGAKKSKTPVNVDALFDDLDKL